MKHTDKDIILISKALDGNQEAYKALYDLYKRNMFVICLRYAKDKSLAQDYLQEAFITIFKNLKQFDKLKGRFEAWAKRVTINVCLSNIRKNSLYAVNIGYAEMIETDEPSALDNLALKDMLNVIQDLPIGYRTVFNMYVIDGFSHKEIAQELGVSISTSKSQLMKAKKLLQKKVKNKANVYSQDHG